MCSVVVVRSYNFVGLKIKCDCYADYVDVVLLEVLNLSCLVKSRMCLVV